MKLLPYDRVSLISPASQMRGADKDLIARAVDLLQSWQLQVENITCPEHHFYLAGRDEERFAALRDALLDPGIRAIFCTRGGYGGARLFRFFDAFDHTVREKFLIGYSDISSLHLVTAVVAKSVIGVHGPNVATSQFLGSSESSNTTRDSLRSLLFSESWSLRHPIQIVKEGVAQGPLNGGCLSLLATALGSRYAPSVGGGIAFLEDTGEPPYKVDRMLIQLKNAGYFEEASGIVFGQMQKCTDPHNDLIAVIQDVLHDFKGPIGFGIPSGHGELNVSLPLGANFTLDCLTGELRSD
jgi:muramoyltetrapeptide carboxypeptidase